MAQFRLLGKLGGIWDNWNVFNSKGNGGGTDIYEVIGGNVYEKVQETGKEEVVLEHIDGNVVIHDLLCDRKMSITLEQAHDLAMGVGFLLQDLDPEQHPEAKL